MFFSGVQLAQNKTIASKDSASCCGVVVCLSRVKISRHPLTHSFLNAVKNSKDFAQKKLNVLCLALNSAFCIYIKLVIFMALSSCFMSWIIRHVFSRMRCGIKHERTDSEKVKDSQAFFGQVVRPARKKHESPFLSTATVDQKTRRAWALLSFSFVVSPLNRINGMQTGGWMGLKINALCAASLGGVYVF